MRSNCNICVKISFFRRPALFRSALWAASESNMMKSEKIMEQTRHYFDNSATTQTSPEAAQLMLEMLTQSYGNPSSLHAMGYEAQLKTEKARRQLAKAMGCEPKNLLFTSGATEANNLALLGAAAAYPKRGKKAVISGFEHSSVEEAARELERQGYTVCRVMPDQNGHITAEQFAALVDESTLLVSCMLVNNEIGSILPVPELVKAVRRKNPGTFVHCDAVQALGKLKIQAQKWDVDYMTVTAHKIHGPKGVGAIYIKQGARVLPRQFGGLQEKGIRPGTENAAGIAAFGLACELADAGRAEHLRSVTEVKNRLLEELRGVEGIVINSPEDGLPYLVNLSVLGIRSEIMMHYLEQEGFYVSSGSACAKGAKSHVLAAMGIGEDRIDSALRISFSRYNTPEEAALLAKRILQGMQEIRR